MEKRKIYAKLTTAILLFVILGALFATSAFAAGNGGGLKNDYSKPGAADITTLTAADIVSKLIGDEELVEAEAAYLELYGEYEINYVSHIPTGVVAIGRDEVSGNFSVKAKKYSYTAKNGAEVLFLPSVVTVGDKTVFFNKASENEYVADFPASYYVEGEKARVLYETEIEIDERDANLLINKAYNDSKTWKALLQSKAAEYEKARADYERNTQRYAEYLEAVAEYEAARLLYDTYRTEKAAYERNLKEYNDYRQALEDYEAKMDDYLKYEDDLKLYNEQYAAYREYIETKDNYDELLEMYQTYAKNIVIVREQLAIIDGIKVKSTDLQRSVYSAVIIGTTVTQVIENKDAIANQTVGVEGQIVDLAGISTENLRKICKEYFAIEGEAEKYAYYVLNYEGFRFNFTNLFISLDKMYSNSKVRLILNEKGIQEKYEILLAQLYYLVNALNDGAVYNYDKTAVYNESYVVNSLTGKTPIKLLDNLPYMPDTENAIPLTTGYPPFAKEPILPETELTEPTRPDFVAKPTKPETVADPGNPPVPVANPGNPPEAVAAPGPEPLPYEAPDAVRALAEEESLTPRDNFDGDVMLKIEIEVLKQLGNVEFFEVKFNYTDENGEACRDVVLVDKGTYADYSGPIPTKKETQEATYTFAGWMDSEGRVCDVTSIESSLELYPFFDKHIKSYAVTWNIEGSLTVTEVEYGQMPVPPSNPQKPDIEIYEYVFIGWDREITEVVSDATYVAKFKGVPICTFEDGSTVSVSRNEDGFIVDHSSKDGKINLGKIMKRLSSTDSVTVKFRSFTLTLFPDTIAKMASADAVSVSVSTTLMQSGSGHGISVNLFNSNGIEVSPDDNQALSGLRISVNKTLDYGSGEEVLLYYLENGERVAVKSSYQYNTLSALLAPGKTYYAVVEYSVNLLPTGEVEVQVPSVAKKGEFVNVTLSKVPKGAVIDMIYYLDAEGNKIQITNGGFYINSGPVFVGVDYHVVTHKITFIAEGKIIYTIILPYGETVTAPPVPPKAADEKYYYTQGFWSPDIVTVSGDAVYEALYLANEHQKTEEPKGVEIFPGLTLFGIEIIPPYSVNMTQSLVDTGALLVLAAFYLCAVMLPLGIIILIKAIRSARR